MEAREKGIEAVVASGICVTRMAREQGMEGVMIFLHGNLLLML